MPTDIANVSRAIKDMYKGKAQTVPTPELIISEVCNFYRLDETTLRGTQKSKGHERGAANRHVPHPQNDKPLPARHCQGIRQKPPTVLYAIRRIEEELPNATNGLQDNIRDIKAKINSRL